MKTPFAFLLCLAACLLLAACGPRVVVAITPTPAPTATPAPAPTATPLGPLPTVAPQLGRFQVAALVADATPAYAPAGLPIREQPTNDAAIVCTTDATLDGFAPVLATYSD